MSGHTSTAACAPLDGMHEVRVARAVGRLDLDVGLGDGLSVRRARQHHRQAGAGGQAAEVAARDAPCAHVFLEVLFEMIFLAHAGVPL